MAFDFLIILFDVPAYIWYWWLDVLVQTGYCGGDSGTTYGIYKQLVLGMLFYMSLRILKIIWHTYGNSKILRYLQEKGFWRKGWVPIIMQRILSCASLTFKELPILIMGAVVLTLSKKNFYIVVIAATAIV